MKMDDRGMPSPRHLLAPFALSTALGLFALLPGAASAQQGLQFGAHTPGDAYSGNINGTLDLERATGRHVDIVQWYQNWGAGEYGSAVQPAWINAVVGSGRTPLLTWEPWAPGGSVQPQYRLQRIVRGDFDSYITSWANALRDRGTTVYLRPMHEMNGDWYPWGGTVNGNSPATYVQAWKHMVDIFRQRGANNVRWIWSPANFDVPANNRLESYYPGTSYVDVLAADGYNWGSAKPEWGGWQSFSQIFSSVYKRLSALGPQPIWIAEVGCAPAGGDKAAWIRDMFAQAGKMDRLKAIAWFNVNKELDWRAAPTSAIARAFAPGAGGRAAADGVPASGADGAGGIDATSAGSSQNGAADTSGRPSLQLTVAKRIRAGRHSTVRWRAKRAAKVRRWHAWERWFGLAPLGWLELAPSPSDRGLTVGAHLERGPGHGGVGSRVEQFEQIRRARDREGLSIRALAGRHGVHRRAVRQALGPLPPAKRSPVGVAAPKLGLYRALIDAWLEGDTVWPGSAIRCVQRSRLCAKATITVQAALGL